MRRTLNLRFLAILLGSTAVLGTGVHFLHGYQVKRNAHALLTQAERVRGEGDLRRAADYLGRYLALAPHDAQARADYGLLLADEKVATSPRARYHAMSVLERALQEDPQRHEVRRKVVQMAMSLGRYTDAKDHLKSYLLPSLPKDGELHGFLGQCYVATGQPAQARESFEQAVLYPPREIDSFLRFASLLRQQADQILRKGEKRADLRDRADQLIDEMVKSHPESFRAYLARARYRRTFAASSQAAEVLRANEKDIEQARKLAADRVDQAEVLLAAAELAGDQGQPDQARAHLHRARDLNPENAQLHLALALLETRQGQAEAALACLRKGLETLPHQGDLLWHLTDLLIQRKQKDEAKEMIARLVQEGLPQAEQDYLKARLLINDGEWLQASRLLEEASPLFLARPGLDQDRLSRRLAQDSTLLLARCYEHLGDLDRTSAAYSRAVAQDAHSVAGRLGLARTEWKRGRHQYALASYQKLMTLPDAPLVGWVEVARLVLLRNLESEKPDWTEVERALQQAERLQPRPVAVYLLRADALAGQGQLDEARAVLVRSLLLPRMPLLPLACPEQVATALLLNSHPTPVEVWVALATLDERQGDAEAALARLDRARQELGDLVELRLARARYWARHEGATARQALSGLTQGLRSFKAEDQVRILSTVASVQARFGETAEARKLWEQVADRQRNDLGSRLALFGLAFQAGDDGEMQHLVEAMHRIEGEDGALWRYGEVCRLLKRAQAGDRQVLARARSLLASPPMRRSTWAQVPLCEAQVDDFDGKPEAALPNYLLAIERGDRGARVMRRAFELLSAQKRQREAYALLRKLPKESLTGDLQRVAAEVSLQANDPAEAVRLAEKAVARDSKDYRDYLWLGQIYRASGHPDRAGPMFLRARDLNDKVSDTWVALVLYLASTGEKDRALQEVEKAERALAGKQAHQALALCWEVAGQTKKAEELFRAALESAPNDLTPREGLARFYLRAGDYTRAEPHLKILMTAHKNKTPKTAAWARRTLAVLLAAGKDRQRSQEALEVLGLVDEASPASTQDPEAVQDQRVRATVLALRPGRKDRQEAIRLLENLIERQTDLAEDHFNLAQLYEATGDWPRARKRLLSLLQKPGGENARYLAHFARTMIRHQDVAAAEGAWQKLKELDAKGFPTLEIEARLLEARGEGAEAVKRLEKHVGVNPDRCGTVAVLLEELRKTDAAERMYRKYVEQARRPTDVLVLARFLGRHNRLEEALAGCARAPKTCPPEAIAQVELLLLTEGTPEPAHYEQVERGLRAAMAQNPRNEALTVGLGHLLTLRGRHDDAETLYRQVLARNGRHAAALNNLAWLLALNNGKSAEALQVLQRAFAVAGPDPGLQDTEAIIYLSMGQSDRAVKVLQAVVANNPQEAIYQFHLAQAQQMAKNRPAAVEALRTAQTLGLKEGSLHPLERPAYQRLLAELRVK